ncbi:MAG: membrane dipeptidase [Patescibacteria group bacterium]
MFYADSLAFLGPQGKSPILDPEINLDLAHVTAAPPWFTKTEEILSAVRNFRRDLERQSIRIITSRDSVDGNGLGIVLGLQGPPHDATPSNLKMLYDAGVRIMQIAYQDSNPYGGGLLHPDLPLTREGKEFLSYCEDIGFILDLSHAGHRTASEALDHFMGAVCVSHTGIYEKHPNPRNLPMSTLMRIQNRGYVGLYTITFGLSGWDNSLAAFQDHLEYFLLVAGYENLGIGSDGAYQEQNPVALREQFGFMKAKIDPDGKIGARSPDQPAELNSPERMRILESVIREIVPEHTLPGIMGQNFQRFLRENLR